MGKTLAIGFGVFLLVLTFGVFLSFRIGKKLFTDTEPYRLAEQHLLQDTLLRGELDTIMIEDFGGYIYSDSAGIIFELKKHGDLVVVDYHLVKDGAIWRISSVTKDHAAR